MRFKSVVKASTVFIAGRASSATHRIGRTEAGEKLISKFAVGYTKGSFPKFNIALSVSLTCQQLHKPFSAVVIAAAAAVIHSPHHRRRRKLPIFYSLRRPDCGRSARRASAWLPRDHYTVSDIKLINLSRDRTGIVQLYTRTKAKGYHLRTRWENSSE